MADPHFWSDRVKAQARSEDLANVKREVSRWEGLVSDLGALQELAAIAGDDTAHLPEFTEQARALEETIGAMETERRFSGKYDRGSAVLSLFAGAGGKDAEDWAAMLRRMYERWAERRGFRVRVLHEHAGDLEGPSGWGIKNLSLSVEGPYAYGNLKYENGVHRLVRISPFDASRRRHTSFALVEVMPELVAPEEVAIRPEEIRVDFFRSSGPGGQNVNKRETAVRITHLPTNIQVAVQVERTQERNREIALELLRARIYRRRVEEQEREAARIKATARAGSPAARGETVSIEWGSQIRSYVLHPYQLVKDHRTGCQTAKVEAVLDGGLDAFLEAELRTGGGADSPARSAP